MVTSANPDRGVYRRLQSALLAGMLASGATSGAQSPVKQILMLQSLDRGNLVLDAFTGEFRARLDQRSRKPVNVVQVVVGQAGFVSAPEQAVVDYVKSMYADRAPPDLIVTVGGPAAAFGRKYRRQLFPEKPLLFASVDERFLRGDPLSENEAAVTVVNDFPRLIDDILRVLPETRQVFMLTGSGALARFWRQELKTGFARFHDRVTFVWSDDLSLPEILHRVARLPPHSAIVYLTFSIDAQGAAYADEQVLNALHATANAPLFGPFSPWFGHGIVGGSLMSLADLTRNTADVAGRILNGETPASLKVPPQVAGNPTFDWRELWRWGISESQLPPGSVVEFRPPSLWAEHKATVLTAVGALVLESLLIALLLYERRARQRAEVESRRNLALAADANRREIVSALTASIGHELGQPLSAIMNNAKTLEIMVARNRAAPDATAEILADIKSAAVLASQIIERHRAMLRSHQLQKKPVDLHSVIDETFALVAHDMRARQIETTLDLSSTPCVIDGDQVLLQQVLVNLVRNAMDAVAETPPASRRITIRSAVTPAGVEISVHDTGTGLPEEIIGTLFTPFVTTKSHGLGIGLTIAQRIVDAHAGTIAAADNENGGATFTVTLPRDAAEDAPRSFHRYRATESDPIPRLNLEQKARPQPSVGERAD
jgi:signal transduction histidine kinase